MQFRGLGREAGRQGGREAGREGGRRKMLFGLGAGGESAGVTE